MEGFLKLSLGGKGSSSTYQKIHQDQIKAMMELFDLLIHNKLEQFRIKLYGAEDQKSEKKDKKLQEGYLQRYNLDKRIFQPFVPHFEVLREMKSVMEQIVYDRKITYQESLTLNSGKKYTEQIPVIKKCKTLLNYVKNTFQDYQLYSLNEDHNIEDLQRAQQLIIDGKGLQNAKFKAIQVDYMSNYLKPLSDHFKLSEQIYDKISYLASGKGKYQENDLFRRKQSLTVSSLQAMNQMAQKIETIHQQLLKKGENNICEESPLNSMINFIKNRFDKEAKDKEEKKRKMKERVNRGIQTDEEPKPIKPQMTETHAQTNPEKVIEKREQYTQMNQIKLKQRQIQTDKQDLLEKDTQTVINEYLDEQIQTEVPQRFDIQVQTILQPVIEKKDKDIQTEEPMKIIVQKVSTQTQTEKQAVKPPKKSTSSDSDEFQVLTIGENNLKSKGQNKDMKR